MQHHMIGTKLLFHNNVLQKYIHLFFHSPKMQEKKVQKLKILKIFSCDI